MYQHPKELELDKIITKYLGKLTAKELFELLFAGQSIYRPGNGLSFKTVMEKLGLKSEDCF